MGSWVMGTGWQQQSVPNISTHSPDSSWGQDTVLMSLWFTGTQGSGLHPHCLVDQGCILRCLGRPGLRQIFFSPVPCSGLGILPFCRAVNSHSGVQASAWPLLLLPGKPFVLLVEVTLGTLTTLSWRLRSYLPPLVPAASPVLLFCSYVPVTPTCNAGLIQFPLKTVLRCRDQGMYPQGGGFRAFSLRDPGPEGRDVNVWPQNTARTGAEEQAGEQKREVAAVWPERAGE